MSLAEERSDEDMRKAILILILLFGLCLGGAMWVFGDALEKNDQVQVTENVLYGDASAGDGLSLTMHTNFDHHLFWDISYSPNSPEKTSAEYRVSPKEDYDAGEYEHTGIYLGAHLDHYYDIEERGHLYTGIGKAYYELYLEVQPGEYKTKEIYIKDYIDYYPISGDMDLPGLAMTMYPEESAWNAYSEANNLEAYEILNEYFRIPVLEEETHEFHLGKDENGKLRSAGGGSGNCEDFFSIYTHSIVMPDAVYFTIHNRSNMKNALMDTSLIPGGYGIYRLPYTFENGSYDVDFKGLSTAKSLDEEFEISYMMTDEAEEHIILIGRSYNQLRVLVIDARTMETKQDILICDDGRTGCWQYYRGEDFLVLGIEEGRLALLEQLNSGEYVLKFVVDDIADGKYYDRYTSEAWAWNGEKLAVCGFKSLDDIYERYVVDFYYAVFDESGLICFTDCDSSLCVNKDEQWSGVRARDFDAMELEWVQ